MYNYPFFPFVETEAKNLFNAVPFSLSLVSNFPDYPLWGQNYTIYIYIFKILRDFLLSSTMCLLWSILAALITLLHF